MPRAEEEAWAAAEAAPRDGEGHVERIAEQLLPLLDRGNRMMLRNLKALKSLREPPVPSVSIGAAGQVNVAAEQVNATDERYG